MYILLMFCKKITNSVMRVFWGNVLVHSYMLTTLKISVATTCQPYAQCDSEHCCQLQTIQQIAKKFSRYRCVLCQDRDSYVNAFAILCICHYSYAILMKIECFSIRFSLMTLWMLLFVPKHEIDYDRVTYKNILKLHNILRDYIW